MPISLSIEGWKGPGRGTLPAMFLISAKASKATRLLEILGNLFGLLYSIYASHIVQGI